MGLTYDKLSVNMSSNNEKEKKMTIQIQKQFDNLEDGIQNMIDAAIYDYGQWMQPDMKLVLK